MVVGAGGNTAEDTESPGQFLCGGEGFFVGDGHYVIQQAAIQQFRYKVGADALNAQVEALAHVVNMRMRSEEQRLTQIAAQLPFLFSLAHTRQMHRIEQLESHLRTSLKQLMVKETHRLQLIEQVTESASPQLMLQRGYSITRCNGKVVRDASILSPGVLLTTEFADGMVQSEVRTPQN